MGQEVKSQGGGYPCASWLSAQGFAEFFEAFLLPQTL